LNIVKNILASFKKFAKNENNSQVAKTLEFEETVKDVEFFQTPGIVSGLTSSDEIAVIPIDGGGYKIGIASNNYSIGINCLPGEIKIFSTDPTGKNEKGIIELGNLTGLIRIANQVEDLKSVLDFLIDSIQSGVTIGSPSTQVFDSTTQANLVLAKTRLGTILKS
jgi:phage gp45-like